MEQTTWLEYIAKTIKSRTVWTVVFLVVTNTVVDLPVSQEAKDAINAILGALAIYFRVNPKQ